MHRDKYEREHLAAVLNNTEARIGKQSGRDGFQVNAVFRAAARISLQAQMAS